MRAIPRALAAVTLALAAETGAAPAAAETTLEKIARTEPYAMAMQRNESDVRAAVNNALMEGIESGKFFEIYDRWFGPRGELPYPMTAAVRQFMLYQVVPR